MAKRIQEAGDDTDLKVVRREIAHIYSIGTFYKSDQTSTVDYDTKYILSFCQEEHRFGFCYYDFSTLKFYLGSFEDDFTLKQFRTLTLQIRPVEAIVPSSV
jgi:DNA mismatch repair ATPase MutS